jgi:hypothetical protein
MIIITASTITTSTPAAATLLLLLQPIRISSASYARRIVTIDGTATPASTPGNITSAVFSVIQKYDTFIISNSITMTINIFMNAHMTATASANSCY